MKEPSSPDFWFSKPGGTTVILAVSARMPTFYESVADNLQRHSPWYQDAELSRCNFHVKAILA